MELKKPSIARASPERDRVCQMRKNSTKYFVEERLRESERQGGKRERERKEREKNS